MAWFRCLIIGENFPLEIGGAMGMLGFTTTRFVEAASAEAAPAAALALLQGERALQVAEGRPGSDLARIRFKDIEEVAARGADTGLAFFSMQEDD